MLDVAFWVIFGAAVPGLAVNAILMLEEFEYHDEDEKKEL